MKSLFESICQLLPQSSLAILEHDDVDHKNDASNDDGQVDDYDDVEYKANRTGNDFTEYNDNKSITF